jgi:hypothetical protein
MPQYDLSTQTFTPGQPIAMHKANFTPDLQESIIGHHFDKSVPSGYQVLSNAIQKTMPSNQKPDPNSVTISKEEYEKLMARQNEMPVAPQPNPSEIQARVNQMFPGQNPTPPVQNEQNLGTTNEPPQQSNEAPDIMARLFGPQESTMANQPQQNEQPATVNAQANDDAQMAERVKANIANICLSKNIMPDDFIQFASSLTMDDIADLYVAFRELNAKQQGGQAPQVQQQQSQYQAAPQPNQAPINLAEVQPNPTDYNTVDRYKSQISQYWK